LLAGLLLLGGFVSFRRQFSHLCVERAQPAAYTTATTTTTTTAAAADAAADATAPRRHGDDAVNEDVCALSNLRLSSSAPTSSSSLSCRSPRPLLRPAAIKPGGGGGGAAAAFPVWVLPNLYLGDAATSRDLACLRRHNIGYIVNVTADVDNAFEHDSSLTYMRIAITDHWSETPTSHFTSAINFIGIYDHHTVTSFSMHVNRSLLRPRQHSFCMCIFMCIRCARPMVWNSLPDDLRALPDYESFRQGLKTWLFSRY